MQVILSLIHFTNVKRTICEISLVFFIVWCNRFCNMAIYVFNKIFLTLFVSDDPMNISALENLFPAKIIIPSFIFIISYNIYHTDVDKVCVFLLIVVFCNFYIIVFTSYIICFTIFNKKLFFQLMAIHLLYKRLNLQFLWRKQF